MIKYLKDMTIKDSGSIQYGVLLNDDYFEIVSDTKLNTEEIAKFLECDETEIYQIDMKDYE
jgi:hypothetical protein